MQFVEHLLALAQIWRRHAEFLECREVKAVVDDLKSLVSYLVGNNSALGKLIGNDKPKCGVVFVHRIPGNARFGVAENLDELVGNEWKAGHGTDRAAQIHGEIARVKPCAEDAQKCRLPRDDLV